MFDSKYKEALENMKLTDDFKAVLAKKMKNVKPIPRARLVLASIAAVLVLTTSVGLAANVASNGKLFRSLFGGQDPQTTDLSTEVTESTEATDVTTTTEETTNATTESTTEATTKETTDATTKETTVETTKETTKETTQETTTPTTTVPETTAPPTTTAPQETTAPSVRVAPVVRASAGDNNVTVSWDRIDSADLVGYKVVASISDSTPQYDENGYYAWITDRNTTSCTITNGDGYDGGDIGCFSGGQAYYFSVTAVYGEEWQKIAGNAVQVTMPGEAAPTPNPGQHVAPVVNAAAQADGVLVTWDRIDASDLDGYKVVYSATNPNPKYPDDGYYAWITDRNTTSCLVKSSDVPAGDYWFSVTALYNGHEVKIAGNAVKATMPGTAAPTPTNPAVTITVTPAEGGVNVSWTPTTDATGFVYYKVVASVNNPNPKYSEDGYYKYFEDPNCTSCFIKTGDGYNDGDVGTFTSGQAYYFSITACYQGGRAVGNAVQVTMP